MDRFDLLRIARVCATRQYRCLLLGLGLVLLLQACERVPIEPAGSPTSPSEPAFVGTVGIPAALPSQCGHQLTGVAFDGTYYYVAEGQFSLYNCVSRYTADGALVDTRTVAVDMRGLHYVPATGQLTTRHYNGGIYALDYASGAVTVLANYRTGPDQYAPAVDPAGGSYWIINGTTAEQHRLSDNALLKGFGIATDNPYMIAVSKRWVYTLTGSTVHVYSKTTGYEVTSRSLNAHLGCQGWGFGASANGDRLLEVTACDNATGQFTGMGGKGLTSSCGRQLTGVAFDGAYYYVVEGQFSANNCISRFTADSEFVDQRLIGLDMRGLHYVPATGKLVTRHYNGGLADIDYPTGTIGQTYGVTAAEQVAPAPDPAGGSYWVINGTTAEQHRFSDNAIIKAFGITTDNPYVIAVSNRWVYTLTGSTVHIYSKMTGYEVATRVLTSPLGCQGWGFGTSANGDRLLEVTACDNASAQLTAMGRRGLTSSCGRQLTGVAYDGTYYYVAEGQFSAYNCISRFTADSEFLDQRLISLDMRGLHYVPATGKLVTRHYNGGLADIDYASGTIGQTYGVVAAEQVAPAPDPAGETYWVINNSNAEQRELSNSAVIRSFPVVTDDPYVIAVGNNWVFTHDDSVVHAYEKSGGTEVAAIPVTLVLGCQGWGFGAAANGDRLLGVSDCGTASAVAITPPPTSPPNAAPVAAFSASPNPATENSSVSFDASASSDPDADALTYDWDFGDGFPHGTGVQASHTYLDNGTYTVTLVVSDGRLNNSATALSTIDNLAPTALFAGSSAVLEGSSFTLSFSNPNDPSPVDQAAGFTYAFDCGDGAALGEWGSARSTLCPTVDGNSSRTVRGAIRDKDGSTLVYSTIQSVRNATPVLKLLSVIGPTTIPVGGTIQVGSSFTDAGLKDGPWTVTFSWGKGATSSFSTSTQGDQLLGTWRYTRPGIYTVYVTVMDKDHGQGRSGSLSVRVQ